MSPDFNILTAMQTIAKLQDEIEQYKARIHDLNERLLEANQDIKDLTWRLERLRP